MSQNVLLTHLSKELKMININALWCDLGRLSDDSVQSPNSRDQGPQKAYFHHLIEWSYCETTKLQAKLDQQLDLVWCSVNELSTSALKRT